jgi:hypothetical protein
MARTRLANQQEDYNWVRDRGEAPMEPPIRLRLVRSSAPKHRGFTVVDTQGSSTQARQMLDSSTFALTEESSIPSIFPQWRRHYQDRGIPFIGMVQRTIRSPCPLSVRPTSLSTVWTFTLASCLVDGHGGPICLCISLRIPFVSTPVSR